MEPLWVMGLMSGTSCDGIDGSLLRTNGQEIVEFGPNVYFSYPEDIRHRIQDSFGSLEKTPEISLLEQELTHFHAQLVDKAQQKFSYPIDLIGFHGQTLFHEPPITWQLGDASLLADLTHKNVVFNFRQNDVLQGGQGAPLVPIYHQAITQNLHKPCAVINIGGVANITWIGENENLIAFDLGPGMALINDWVNQELQYPFDEDGLLGQKGKVHGEIVSHWITDPYFSMAYPKSLDRNHFYKCLADINNLSAADGAATLTAFTAAAICCGLQQLPQFPKTILLSGGGRRNQFLFELVAAQMPTKTHIARIDILGFDGDYIESQAFAYLAARTKNHLPITFPLTTGVPIALSGGQIVHYHEEHCG